MFSGCVILRLLSKSRENVSLSNGSLLVRIAVCWTTENHSHGSGSLARESALECVSRPMEALAGGSGPSPPHRRSARLSYLIAG